MQTASTNACIDEYKYDIYWQKEQATNIFNLKEDLQK